MLPNCVYSAAILHPRRHGVHLALQPFHQLEHLLSAPLDQLPGRTLWLPPGRFAEQADGILRRPALACLLTTTVFAGSNDGKVYAIALTTPTAVGSQTRGHVKQHAR
jgi:hypothetical protein